MTVPLDRLRTPSQPALSPDGTSVVYVVRMADLDADEDRTSLWRVPVHGGAARQLTGGPADSCPAWSPDGGAIAFVRAGGAVAQIHTLPADGGESVQVTALPGGAGAPVWSPDGTRIAFAAPVDTWEADGGGGDRAGRDGNDHAARRARAPIVIDRLGYKADGTGLLRGHRKHLFVVDLRSSTVRQLTSGDWHASDPVWSPDGGTLAFGAPAGPDADLTGASAVYVVDADIDEPVPRLVGDPDGLATPVAWSPGGEDLLVVGSRKVGVGHTRLLRVPVAGGVPVDLTEQLDRNVMPGGPGYPGGLPRFHDGHTVLFCARNRGCTQVYAVGLDGGEPELVVGGPGRVVSGLSVASGRAAVVVSSPRSYGAVAVVDLETGVETVLNDDTPTDVEPFVAEERSFAISDGTVVHGWLIRDRRAPAPAPLLLDVHGGPHNAWSPVLDAEHVYHQMLAARGWTVLLVNPRGSDGYGEQFYTAAVGSWGLADEKDLLEPVDELVREGLADPERLAVSGYSYGGYMACWLTGRTDRFAAAVAGGVVTDLASMAGTSDEGRLLTELETRASAHGHPERLAAQSPLTYVAGVATPMLILHGLADHRCPAGQAEQWFAALRARGVPAELVLYPEAGHLFILDGRPSHRADYCRRIVDWLTHHTAKEPRVTVAELDRGHWERRLAELAKRCRVPGAALGIERGDETLEIGYGVANVDTGVDVTADTLFQIGSVTKVWTASVVMSLVDEGLLDLDEPLATYLPELVLSDREVTEQVTMRHLLTHTSGIDGDVFIDTGRGDDCLERYVARLADVPLNHPLGATWSYCNSGYSIAGRVIETLTGQVWDHAMKERLFEPLGLSRTVTLPEEALLHRTATGHVHEDDEPFRRAPVWGLERSGGPAGMITSTVGDVLAFARMHLAGGTAADGRRVLSERSVAAMRAHEAALPDTYTIAQSWGLGWFRLAWNGAELIGHDGNTIGQSAFLRIVPEQGLAVTLLTNGGFSRDLYESLVREVFRELAGIEMAAPLQPPDESATADVTPYAGTYERAGARIEVWQADTGPRLRLTITLEIAGIDHPPREFDLIPVRDRIFAVRAPGARTWTPVTFYTLDDGTPYLHMGVRATRKVG
ncbi:serine hydrolase [Actinobacteria bacterium YIM 96077]|uniref:Serine hydrolase n=1 Tax=Phytoactinopolyspora halophila TaxID=1981511 RepID=A0A329R1S0_9ACTN|nr:serine hydrolase [Phytoactinopolyspora halophila]AYY12201.1 serine hydrolase [Actinobacteria bacterium YIM 96077]RAW18565.1 serine hydrolase [Phytoactinopolyspora halophila]